MHPWWIGLVVRTGLSVHRETVYADSCERYAFVLGRKALGQAVAFGRNHTLTIASYHGTLQLISVSADGPILWGDPRTGKQLSLVHPKGEDWWLKPAR